MGVDLPQGRLALLFTDIEGSTALLHELGDGYGDLLEEHHRAMRTAIDEHRGHEVDTEGDAFFVVFQDAADAVAAALAAQRSFLAMTGPGRPLRVRMGIHVGDAQLHTTGYVGAAVHEAARVAGAANGGQVLVTESVVASVGNRWSDGEAAHDLGFHRLKDFPEPQRLFRIAHPALPVVENAPRTLGPGLYGVPLLATPLVGRDSFVEEVAHLLTGGEVRLVTMTGVGGVGKTSVATALARRVAPMFNHGAAFVPLAPVSDASRLEAAVEETLGLRDLGGRTADLHTALAPRQLLLVLDNFEHLIPAAPRIAELLAACPNVTVLVTSRVPLRVAGERVVEVQPLSPDDEAIALFDARARDAVPSWVLSEQDRELVADICRRLDGLPLAVELAAARLRVLSLADLSDRLADRLGTLVGRRADVPSRQRTIAEAIGWSHDLLPPDDRVLFRRLAVFAGGWTLAAAAAIGGCGEGAVLDILEDLVDHSLVQRVADGGSSSRLAMLETVRAFAERELDAAGERVDVEERHLAWCSDLACRLAPVLAGPSRDRALMELDHEAENLRAALQRALGAGEQRGVELAVHLGWWWYHRGRLEEGLGWLEQAVAVEGVDPLVRVEAMTAAARLARYLERIDLARTLAEEAVALASDHGGGRPLAYALYVLGLALERSGDPAAVEQARDAVTEFRQLDDPWGLALALFYFGTFALLFDQTEDARAALQESGARFADLGDEWGTGGALFYLGTLAHRQGRLPEARKLMEDSIHRFRAAGDRWRVAQALMGLAAVAGEQGHDVVALEAEAAALLDELGVPPA